jgi:2-hydroxy-3-keto-5-methylthiopentenyl-1-phosphate phosphatase
MSNIIACIYDFDGTLIKGDMQKPLFNKYGLDINDFFSKAAKKVENAAKQSVEYDRGLSYLNLFLDYVKEGKFAKLSNQELFEVGKEVLFYPGVRDFLEYIKEEVNKKYSDVNLEHYIISTGFKKMIEGSEIYPLLDGIFASEFIESRGKIKEIANCVGSTNKTRYLYQIKKGLDYDINDYVKEDRIPFKNMIYFGDGFTDIPCFSVLNKFGGTSIGIHDRDDYNLELMLKLVKDKRVLQFLPADYTPKKFTSNILMGIIDDIVKKI